MRHFLASKTLQGTRSAVQLQYSRGRREVSKMDIISAGSDFDTIWLGKAICAGYFHQAARVEGIIAEFVNIRSGLLAHLHPTSALSGLGSMLY
ncbi:hypothetical protein DFH94DRAFT_754369 [Russula ochroleuca]|uniref:Uncharacterized protein n=1 Tax=Russula ochroleuca TaxID=152965 RepID=A0A9P5T6R4_9AGAM|nr:hypothetical protein DFH94DRAFT_754369 [Russula ochroleuca]